MFVNGVAGAGAPVTAGLSTAVAPTNVAVVALVAPIFSLRQGFLSQFSSG